MADLKILVVGGGSIGERHLRTFLRAGGVAASICEPRKEKLEHLKKTYPVERAFERFEDAPLDDFDAVVICTPPNLHIPMAQAAADANCHILVEKPLSNDLHGVDELIDVVEKKGLVAGVAFVYRHMPMFVRMKEMLDDGAVGKVRLAVVKNGQQFSKYRPDYRNIYFAKAAMGGGAILDAVSHSLNYLEWCLGRETEVCCMYDHLSEMEIETEDVAMLLFRFENDVMAQIHQNLFQKDTQIYVEFIGSEGTIRLGGEIKQGSAQPRIGFLKDEDEGWQFESLPPCERDDYFVWQAQNFMKAIAGEEPIRATLDEGRRTLEVCLKAKESYVEKRILSV